MTEGFRPSPIDDGAASGPKPRLAEGEPIPLDPEQPIDDPYVVHAPPPPRRPGLSVLAVASVIALPFGPIGAIGAIVLGLAARREIDRSGKLRGHALATAGASLGAIVAMAWAVGLPTWAWMKTYRPDHGVLNEPVAAEPAAQPGATARAPAATPPVARPPGSAGPGAPKHTRARREGQVAIVDLGVSVSSLTEELAKQRAEAAAQGETVLVMTTAADCDPCRGVDESIADARMQAALARIRLVRVDLEVFGEDLDALKIPHRHYPGFFLLAPDLTPKDGIDGGEWDDDVARNIAPVLHAFVRGRYVTRRKDWRPLPGSGVRL